MMALALRKVTTVLAWFAAIVLFVLSPAIGSISSIAVVLLTILLSPIAFMRGSWRSLKAQPAMLMLLGAFAALTLCFVINQRQPTDVLFATNFLGLLLAPVVYLLAVRRPGARTIAIVAALFVLGAIAGALTGSYDVFVLHKERAIGWGSGGNLMARSVVPLGFMALSGIFALRSNWRWLYLLGPAAALYALYLTSTRGVFIAVPVLGLLFVWALIREFRGARIWYFAGVGALLVVLILVALLSPRFLGVTSLLEQVLLDPSAVPDFATSQRMYMWSAGWATFLKSPWIGFGWANFTAAAVPYGISNFHNDFFDIAVAAGSVGIAGWIAVLLAPIVGVTALPKDRFSTLRLYCALLLSSSFFIFGLTDMTFGYDLPTTLYAFMTALVLGALREASPVDLSPADR
ncbi:MAG: O-antigen ligase family protein [Devosia sp.]